MCSSNENCEQGMSEVCMYTMLLNLEQQKIQDNVRVLCFVREHPHVPS